MLRLRKVHQMKKQFLVLAAASLMATGANAANVSSVSCSLSSIAIEFDANINSGDVTSVVVQAGENARVSYELNAILPGSVSGSTLTLTTNTDTQNELKKVPPWSAYIKVGGTNIDSGAACD